MAEHAALLEGLSIPWRLVLSPADLPGLSGLILPGGETTTQRLLWQRTGLWDALPAYQGPILGTCAGAIHLASATTTNDATLGLLDITVKRNGWGTQRESFKGRCDLPWAPLEALFVRAPRITCVGPGVESLASCRQEPAVVRQGRLWAATCHPEALGQTALHEAFITACRGKVAA